MNCQECGKPTPPRARAFCSQTCQYHARNRRRRVNEPPAQHLLGDWPNTGSSGGTLPAWRPTYPAHVARALHALAESRPDPITYARERARILNYDRKTSERLEQR